MSRLAYSRQQAAEECGLSIDTIKKAINTGALRAKRTSTHPETGEPTGKYVILHDDLTAWLEGLVAA